MPVLLNVLTGIPQALSSIQMIIICAATDVLPALSLVMEQPEADLLLRKPRDRKKDRLASWKLICHAYLFLGVLESLTSFIGYVLLPQTLHKMGRLTRVIALSSSGSKCRTASASRSCG